MRLSIFLKTLRDYRFSVLIWGGGLAALLAYYAWVYIDLFKGPSGDKRLAEYQRMFDTFSFITGKAYDLDTYGGFITAEFLTYLPVITCLFALLAGSALIRKEEERGSLDILLAAPFSRREVLLQKWAGFAVNLAAIVIISFAGLLGGALANDLVVDFGGVLLACLNVLFISLLFGTLALALAQLMSRKAAAGWAGGLLAAGFLMNTLGEAIKNIDWLRSFTPFYYYSLSKPLARSVGMDWGAFALTGFSSLPLLAAALVMYARRDHNSVWQLRAGKNRLAGNGKKAPSSPWLAGDFLFGLRRALPGALIWSLCLSSYAVFVVPFLGEIRGGMSELLNSDFYKMLGFSNLVSNENLLSLMFFLFAMPLLAAYCVILVADWTGDETEGRLELFLATPASRWRWLLTRFAISLLATLTVIALCGASFAITCQVANVPVNATRAVEAFAGLWILCVIVLGAGFGLAGLVPDKAVGILSGLVVISFLAELLREALKLPGWLLDLSIFHQYGQPIVSGISWLPQFIMLALGAAFVTVGGLRFWQRDVLK